ncbi:hypothetical protein HUJ04_002044 [Dendroctonus ponderosae]|nr:hypothetical protein HUJ04_002044 [Dendroctonus ponderosae]
MEMHRLNSELPINGNLPFHLSHQQILKTPNISMMLSKQASNLDGLKERGFFPLSLKTKILPILHG